MLYNKLNRPWPIPSKGFPIHINHNLTNLRETAYEIEQMWLHKQSNWINTVIVQSSFNGRTSFLLLWSKKIVCSAIVRDHYLRWPAIFIPTIDQATFREICLIPLQLMGSFFHFLLYFRYGGSSGNILNIKPIFAASSCSTCDLEYVLKYSLIWGAGAAQSVGYSV
jgi:hypothetical protein